jgi:hypothetical protein
VDDSQENCQDERISDFGLIAPIAIPRDARIPDPVTGMSTVAEYDRYFRIVRTAPDLVEWSRVSARLHDDIMRELDATSLSGEQRCNLTRGLAFALRAALERWVQLADRLQRDIQPEQVESATRATR